MRNLRPLLPPSTAAACASLALAALLAACGGKEAPNPKGRAAYLESHGVAPAAPDAAAAPTEIAAPPKVPAKRIRLTVVSAEGLPDFDDGPGETDPYVILEYDGERHETSVADGTLEPRWGDSFVYEVRSGATLRVTLMDRDSITSDEKMGVRTVQLEVPAAGEKTTLAVAFRDGDNGTVHLEIEGL